MLELYYKPRLDVRPQLLRNEALLLVQPNVGLYEGDEKAQDHQKGTLYLTSLRLVWINGSHVEFPLELIKDSSISSAFLTASAKIILNVQMPFIADDSILWTCQVCQAHNPIHQRLCQKCGIKSSYIPCPQCSFMCQETHEQCDVCGFQFQTKDVFIFKLSFRSGGAEGFHAALVSQLKQLKQSLQNSSGMSSNVGLNSIIRNMDQTRLEQKELVNSAFEDLDELMACASEMATLTRSLAGILSSKDKNVDDFQAKVASMGLSFGGLLKSDVRDSYFIELAREISDFLDLKMKDYHGIMSLVDLYCLYNRIRSTDLISPQDLEKACQYLSAHTSYTMVTFTTGTKLIHSQQKSIDKLVQMVKELAKECQHGFESMEASQRLNLSLSVTEEIIMTAEEQGHLCRDESVGQTFYFHNEFVLLDTN